MALTDIAGQALAQLRAGSPARLTFGEDQPAWSWVEGFSGLSTAVTGASCAGMTFTAQRVAPSGTPADIVAPAGPKPTAVVLTPQALTLKKHAGVAICTLEQQLSSSTLLTAMGEALIAQAMGSFETDLVASVIADADVIDVGVAPDIAGLLQAQAAVMANGGSPNLIALSPADYAGIAAVGSPSLVAFNADVSQAVMTLLGSQIVVSAALPTGTAIVADKTAILAVQEASSPGILFDPYSASTNNQLRVIVDLVGIGYVARPGSVALVVDPG